MSETKEHLNNKTAVVTGAGAGIGLAVSRALAKAGATVFMTDLNEDVLSKEVQLLEDENLLVKGVVVDVTSEDSINSLSEQVLSESGGADILVNNAGLQIMSPIADFPVEKWDLLNSVMLRGAFLCMRQFVPQMVEGRWGRVINIASIHSIVGSPFKSAYVSAKHGLIGLTKTVALETAAKGVTVNAISPAYVRTKLVEKQIEAQAKLHSMNKEEVIANIMLAPMPQKELIEAEEIGDVVVFLCSLSARHINGHNLVMDGGWTAA